MAGLATMILAAVTIGRDGDFVVTQPRIVYVHCCGLTELSTFQQRLDVWHSHIRGLGQLFSNPMASAIHKGLCVRQHWRDHRDHHRSAGDNRKKQHELG